MKPSGFALAVLVLLTSPVMAQSLMPHSAAVGGAGVDACSAWTADRDAKSESAQQASQRRIEWVFGFFSAVNLFDEPSGNLHGSIDHRDEMLGWIDDHCRKNPDDPLFVATTDLALELRNPQRN